jgi:hypothetical protein
LAYENSFCRLPYQRNIHENLPSGGKDFCAVLRGCPAFVKQLSFWRIFPVDLPHEKICLKICQCKNTEQSLTNNGNYSKRKK